MAGIGLSLAGLLVLACCLGLWRLRQRRQQQAGRILLEATEAGDLQRMRQALAHGAAINIANAQGWTPLHIAAAGGDVTVLALLLEHGADVQAVSNIGTTPLYNAMVFGQKTAVVELLLAHGARPESAWDAMF
jgi:ankyrin repeat protein